MQQQIRAQSQDKANNNTCEYCTDTSTDMPGSRLDHYFLRMGWRQVPNNPHK
jgi:hypothetical protein